MGGGEGAGRGGAESCEPDASSVELRGSEALLCAPSRRAELPHRPELRGAGEARPRPRAPGSRSFGRSVTGFLKRTGRALGSKTPIGLRARISRLTESWSQALGAEEGPRSGEGGGGGGGGERSLEERRRSSTVEAAALASKRRRRALACRGPDLVWGGGRAPY